MNDVVTWLDATFSDIPLSLLEVWGRFAFIVGALIAVLALTGFTLRPGGRWWLGRERQAWDAKALVAIPVTFVLVIATGFLGSFVVLVPGAQTFESLKDLVVFLCIVLFGYPALITVPFAYGLSDLVEGVPPDFLLAWLPGYFINPCCFWIAYQLIGKSPDFRRLGTWGRYLVFVAMFMLIEPVLWGFVCSPQFTPELSYRTVTPALFFTTAITWVLAPLAMLVALPAARRLGIFWAEIPGHVRERLIGKREWVWESGSAVQHVGVGDSRERGLPIRMLLLGPFIALVLVLVGVTAFVTLRAAQGDATRLALQLHREISDNIDLRLDAYLLRADGVDDATRQRDIQRLLVELPIAQHGRALVLDRKGRVVASSAPADDPIVREAIGVLGGAGALATLGSAPFRFDHVTSKPLGRETWLAQATAYREGVHDWVLVTLMPESYFLAGVHAGNSRSAIVFAIALLLSLTVAALLASLVTTPLTRLSRATQALAAGALGEQVPPSRLEELGELSKSFNEMAQRLQQTFSELVNEVGVRERREHEAAASEARALASENRLRLATRAGRLAVWDWDIETDRLHWDDAMYELYGVRKESFSGAYEAWTSSILPEDRARAEENVQAALRGEREFSSDFRVLAGDGTVRSIRGVAQTLRGEDGQARRMVGINWDVTTELAAERELRRHRDHLEELVAARTLELERSESRTKGILESLADGVVTIDGQGRIHGFSSAATGIFGYAPEEVLGRNVAMLMPEPDTSRHDDYIARYLATGEARIIGIGREVVGRRKDGTTFPMDLAIAAVSIGSERIFTAVVRDIAERKRAQQALHLAKEAADAANRAKSVFLANMSHEIRTPMNAILGFGQLLERDSDLTSRDRDRLAKIMASGHHLLEVIDNVLEMSKIEAGRLELNPTTFDLHAALGHVDTMVRRAVERKGLRFEVVGVQGLPRFVRTDAVKLRQILVNLVSNAGKFTERGKVVLRASGETKGDEVALRFEVEDSGLGIAPEEIPKVFEPFGQTVSGLAQQTGTGLGVPISRDFARLMGGDLTVKSELHVGTTFTLDIVASLAEPVSVRAGVERVVRLAASETVPTVLVVDDKADNRAALRELLAGIGVAVVEAADGAEALVRFGEVRPDFVFMDVKMPSMDGVEATRRLRETEAGARVPIVILSASVFYDERRTVLETGADAFIAKPFRAGAIFDVLQEHLGVVFEHAPDTSEPKPEELVPTREAVAALGEETLGRLREAIQRGYVQRVPAILAGVADEHERVVSQLCRLADELELDVLAGLL